MNFCQRILQDAFDFRVSAVPDELTCGKPAMFRSNLPDDEDGRKIVLWLCARCFDEYEARFGTGAWADEDATGRAENYTNSEEK